MLLVVTDTSNSKAKDTTMDFFFFRTFSQEEIQGFWRSVWNLFIFICYILAFLLIVGVMNAPKYNKAREDKKVETAKDLKAKEAAQKQKQNR